MVNGSGSGLRPGTHGQSGVSAFKDAPAHRRSCACVFTCASTLCVPDRKRNARADSAADEIAP
jgi:hypothetical protein